LSVHFHILKPSYDPAEGVALFPYALGALRFTEVLEFPRGGDTDAASSEAFHKLLDLTAVVLGASYFKLLAPTRIEVEFPLTARERDFAFDIYTNGLGEFYARNQLEHFNKIEVVATVDQRSAPPAPALRDRALLPIGGGKDSIVSVELLEAAGLDYTPFAVNPKGPILGSIGKISRTPIYVKRTLDREMMRLRNEPGYLNGHVPSTAINSMIAALTALLFSYARVILSNERSASEGNAIHEGREVNHQHSKSDDFERLIADVINDATGGALAYFSLLRPYSEARIAALFARETRFDEVFSSCNENFKLSGDNVPLWCGKCPKCHFTFLMMAPRMGYDRMMRIFGKDFLDDSANEESYRALTGLAGQKPWECVGEIEEAAACLHILTAHPDWQDAAIVRTLKDELIAQYGASRLAGALEKLFKDSDDHYIPRAIAERIAPYAL